MPLKLEEMMALSKEEQDKIYKRIKRIRDSSKNTNYAAQYGAFPKKIAQTANVDIETATTLYDAYWTNNWAWKVVTSKQKIKTIDNQMWLQNPINGFWYSLRSEKDTGSTLVQGTASFVFDFWVRFVLQTRPQLTAQFHDEIVLEINEDEKDEILKLLEESIDKANASLKLNRELAIGIQYGYHYGNIH